VPATFQHAPTEEQHHESSSNNNNNTESRGLITMCGIGAFQIVNSEVDPAKVARVLLRLLEERGRDAAGVAWHANGDTLICKDNCAGKELARRLQTSIGNTGIVHTRWATQGSPTIEGNNHPIDANGIVGVHNGHIRNDVELLKMCVDYKRQAQVDSEAVFALLAHAPAGWTLEQRVEHVRGNAALLWLESYDETETLHAARLTSSPLFMAQTVAGSVVFASTARILQEVGKRCELQFEYMHELKEGTYMRCTAGMVTEYKELPIPQVQPQLFRHDYSKASKYQSF
jgi:glucosamine 6-phosphate synthetase-like amidotransferase/phosphosugar isomerase protein